MKFCFGDIVVVEDNLIGVVVKDWISSKSSTVNSDDREVRHEVYVRYFNGIKEYREDQMERYMVRHKYLDGDEIIYQSNAVHNTIDALDTPLTEAEQKLMELLKSSSAETFQKGWNIFIGAIVYSTNPVGREKTLCVRAFNTFLRHRINTLEDFFNKTPYEIKHIQGLGDKSLKYFIRLIFTYCEDHNIETKYKLEDYLN